MEGKIMNVSFSYELPSGQTVNIEAEVSPVTPQLYADLNGPGEPAEGGDVDILSARLVCNEDNEKSVEIDLDHLWYRKRGSTEFTSVTDEIQEWAFSEAERWAA